VHEAETMSNNTSIVMLGGLLTAIAAGGSTAVGAGGPAAFDAATDAFFATHCVRCHSADTQEGRFRLDTLSRDFSDIQASEKWAEVLSRINAGEMPPEEEPRPTREELGRTVDLVTRLIQEGAAARMAKRGPVELYRLSREEYAHTAHDLLGVFFDINATGSLVDDPRWHGFERVGAVLALAPAHVERYVRAADALVRQAFPDGDPGRATSRMPSAGGSRWLLWPGSGVHLLDIPTPGRYRVRVQVSGLASPRGRVPRLALWHMSQKRTVAGVNVAAAEDAPATVEIEALLPAGAYEIRNDARPIDLVTGVTQGPEQVGRGRSITTLRGGSRAPKTKIVGEDGRVVVPLLLVDSVEVEGPIVTAEEQARRASFVPAKGKEDDPAELRACLRRFAERAWRRPVTDAELERYEKFYSAERAEGESAKAAHRAVLASMLVARSFLHLEEGSAGERRPQVNDFELAARLSYFLWSSLPDEDLAAAARSGALGTPDGLAAQVDRMLADPKIERFLQSFPRQWLQLYRVGMFQPDPVLYPDYDPWLEQSMVLETTASFREVFRENLPLGQLLDADWTMLNPRLAIHYGLPIPKTSALQRVTLPPESHRGGILTQASTLSLTSDGTRHRPVHRGAWVSEAIFARTPPPPPPNVEPLEPVPSDKPKATIREQLAAHSTNATCASCHSKIDPLGLAFDNFDAIGRWRTHERVEGGTGDDPPVDASGTLPDGRSFAGPAEFKRLLAESPDAFARAFVEQLATYALRRVMTVDDAAALDAITAQSKADGYRLESLVRALATSELLRRR
jgi:hypothetical protein